ncbi:MAG: hypothetical protein GC190_21920 [Alphaproteobacteria bacterium]|nr:hypothetical protein [Alphaproteobacteria bacterium]
MSRPNLKGQLTVAVDGDFPLPPRFRGAGVYLILNRKTNLVYVGGTRRLAHRWRQHCRLLHQGKHPNKRMLADWKTHGSSVFRFIVLQECRPSALLRLEQHVIDRLKACDPTRGYNSQKKARSNRVGVRERKEVVAARMAKQRGRKLSASHRRRISAAMRVRESKPEWGCAISRAKSGKPRPDIKSWAPDQFKIFDIDEVAEIRRRYKPRVVTFRQLAEEYGCNQSTIYNVVNGIGLAYAAERSNV